MTSERWEVKTKRWLRNSPDSPVPDLLVPTDCKRELGDGERYKTLSRSRYPPAGATGSLEGEKDLRRRVTFPHYPNPLLLDRLSSEGAPNVLKPPPDNGAHLRPSDGHPDRVPSNIARYSKCHP